MESAERRRSFPREWAMRLVLFFLSSLIAIALAEVIASSLFPISDGLDNLTLDGKPIKGWFEPGSVYRQVSNEYDAITTITDKGHRVPGVKGNPDVVFIGDSFTYGFGLSDDETFAAIYCKYRHYACANLGMPGSGTLRQVERLEKFINGWNWKPTEVKLFFFGMSGSFSAGNDFVDNYDRYIREHASEHQEQDEQMRLPKEELKVGLAERLIGWQTFVLGHSTLMRLIKYYWGPVLKSMLVADPGKERMKVALVATKESLVRLENLSRQVGFNYTIYLLVPVQDVIRGTYEETLATLNSVSPKPVVPTAHLFLDSPQTYYYAFDGHLNPKGSRLIAQFLLSTDSGES